MKKSRKVLTIGIIVFILTVAITIEVRTISKANIGNFEILVDNDLREQVLKLRGRYETTFKELEDKTKELEKIRSEATKDVSGAEEKEDQIKKNNTLLGLTNVQGEGVEITLKDNNQVSADSLSINDDISYYLVHDIDLRSLVNELKNAGAEAISINDERVVSSSSITCEGTVISINGKKISSPFKIKAIGPAYKLYSALTRPGGYVESLNRTGIKTTVTQLVNVEIAKYNGVINSKYMKYSD